jgi:hypothetical protein
MIIIIKCRMVVNGFQAAEPSLHDGPEVAGNRILGPPE